MPWARRRRGAPSPSLLSVLLLCCQASAETVCGYDGVTVVNFDAGPDAAGLWMDPPPVGGLLPVQMRRLGVFNKDLGKPSIDIKPTSETGSKSTCSLGLCPVYVDGKNLPSLVAVDPETETAMQEQGILPHHRAFCFFGAELPCAPMVAAVQDDKISCASPTLPEEYGIAPFGVFVLGPMLEGPGTLYLADGLEFNFYDTRVPPEPLYLVPPYSDYLDLPDDFRVMGWNFGPGEMGVYCQWTIGGVELDPRQGEYDADLNAAGDDVNELQCPGPNLQASQPSAPLLTPRPPHAPPPTRPRASAPPPHLRR